MTPTFDFDKASPQERNEAIAGLLGWKRCNDEHGTRHANCWGAPTGQHHELPDFQGDDGLAFKKLWPEIEKLTSECWIQHAKHGDDLEYSQICTMKLGTSVWTDYRSDSWAHCLCKAFLELKGNQ